MGERVGNMKEPPDELSRSVPLLGHEHHPGVVLSSLEIRNVQCPEVRHVVRAQHAPLLCSKQEMIGVRSFDLPASSAVCTSTARTRSARLTASSMEYSSM